MNNTFSTEHCHDWNYSKVLMSPSAVNRPSYQQSQSWLIALLHCITPNTKVQIQHSDWSLLGEPRSGGHLQWDRNIGSIAGCGSGFLSESQFVPSPQLDTHPFAFTSTLRPQIDTVNNLVLYFAKIACGNAQAKLLKLDTISQLQGRNDGPSLPWWALEIQRRFYCSHSSGQCLHLLCCTSAWISIHSVFLLLKMAFAQGHNRPIFVINLSDIATLCTWGIKRSFRSTLVWSEPWSDWCGSWDHNLQGRICDPAEHSLCSHSNKILTLLSFHLVIIVRNCLLLKLWVAPCPADTQGKIRWLGSFRPSSGRRTYWYSALYFAHLTQFFVFFILLVQLSKVSRGWWWQIDFGGLT